ncbi:sodium- and chloride-dependent GABA transporter ine isoform X1 [Onthophagus taurus]|uniref:sodium- and chloride-dependent GABA transporter ine isoform X1 n=1 Tax=Onthophagus taurus TaxID=166361 RepID=UPI0039BE0CEE
MEETKLPVSVGIPHQKLLVHDLQFNSGRSPNRVRSDRNDIELVQSPPLRKSPLETSFLNNNKGSYVSGHHRLSDHSGQVFLAALLEAMREKDHNLKINIPVEMLPNRSSPSSGLRQQLSIADFSGNQQLLNHQFPSRTGSDSQSLITKPYDAVSLKSYTSIGMGSTDGKKMTVRKIPTSPVELFNLVNPPMPPAENSPDDFTESTESLDDKNPRRQQWANKLQFVLACVGYSVGLGSVWRFPYLCYKSGGGVFLIPYFLIMTICGVPMLYMELAVGQFIGRGPIAALGSLCPLFKGAGLGSVVVSFLMSTYYCVIIAYGVYYFFTSFKPKHPWIDCTNRWNTEDCWIPARLNDNKSRPFRSHTPAEEFYDVKVLQISDGLEDFGTLRWELVACLLCAWVLVYFGLWKSIKSSAKVRYLTATLPFILIIVFLAKSLTLEGAELGLRYFFKPKWNLLKDAKVWINALAQTFNSMGIAFGSMISFASYNKFENNIIQDTLAVSFVNAITSLLVGIFAFATLGNIATEQNTSIDKVITDGPGLIFVVYPQALAKMPASHLWSVLFFFMLLCLALNSQFAIVEVVVTSIQDGFPNWIKKNLMCHEVLVLVICVVSFFCGLPNVTNGGIYFFQLIDHYAASISIMYLAFFEIVAIAWFYGVKRLSRDIEDMTGRQPSLYFKFCWYVAAPLMIFSIWVFYMIAYEQPTYGNYAYPKWAIAIGWIITSSSILCIPIFMIYVITKAEGDTCWKKLKNSIKPDLEECRNCKTCISDHHEPCYEQEPMIGYQPGVKRNGIIIAPVGYSPVQTNTSTESNASPTSPPPNERT